MKPEILEFLKLKKRTQTKCILHFVKAVVLNETSDICIYKLELKYRVEKISKIKRVEDELFLLIFSTRSLTNLLQ